MNTDRSNASSTFCEDNLLFALADRYLAATDHSAILHRFAETDHQAGWGCMNGLSTFLQSLNSQQRELRNGKG
jgi:hypothetical protein